MDYTPRTWTDGEIVTMGMLNAELRDLAAGLMAPWVSYDPAWASTGTQPSIGNGAVTASYRRIGKTIEYQIRVIAGSSTDPGTGSYRWRLPYPSRTPGVTGNGFVLSAAGDIYGRTVATTGTTLVVLVDNAANRVGATAPAVPAAGVLILLAGVYETT